MKSGKKFRILSDIFNKYALSNKLIVLPPTIFEIINYLNKVPVSKNYDDILKKPAIANFYENYNNYLNDKNDFTFQQSVDSYENLGPIQNYFSGGYGTPIQKLQELLIQNKIRDYSEIEKIDKQLPKGNEEIFQKVFDELEKKRPLSKEINNMVDANTAAIVYELDDMYNDNYYFSVVTHSKNPLEILEKIIFPLPNYETSIVRDPIYLYTKSLINESNYRITLDDIDEIIQFFKILSNTNNPLKDIKNIISLKQVNLIERLFYIDNKWSFIFQTNLIESEFFSKINEEYHKNEDNMKKIAIEGMKLTFENLKDFDKFEMEFNLTNENLKKLIDDIFKQLYNLTKETSYLSITPQITETYKYIIKKR